MIHIYYIITLIITAIVAFNAPALTTRIKRYINGIKRKQQTAFRTAVRAEVRKYLEELKTK